MKRFSIKIWWSEEDNAWLAQCIEQEGLMTHGDTPKDAAREMETVLEMAAEVIEEDNS